MSKIIRVFPRKTSMSPTDHLAFFGDPTLFRPEADEVHISVTFTWDIKRGQELLESWKRYYPVVKIGGPAFGESQGEFVPGRYVKQGVTFTSRGCNRSCPWCLVPSKEGKLIEIENFGSGYIIQDNNLLQASRAHQEKVYAMLRKQPKSAEFSGGIDSRLVDDWFAEQMKTLRINQLFLAADTDGMLSPLEEALKKLSFLGRKKLRVYAMVGYNGESLDQAINRCEKIWEMGAMPFAQLYQPADRRIEYSPAWKDLAREWSRPAIMHAKMNGQTAKEMNEPIGQIRIKADSSALISK